MQNTAQTENPKAWVRSLIIQDKIKEALNFIRQYAEKQKESDLDEACILQLGRYNSMQNQKNSGTISQENYELSRNRIREAANSLCEQMTD